MFTINGTRLQTELGSSGNIWACSAKSSASDHTEVRNVQRREGTVQMAGFPAPKDGRPASTSARNA